jgi:hypothetical protein
MTTTLDTGPIDDDEIVMRRVRPSETTTDRPGGRERPSGQAFIQNGRDGDTSVYLKSETTAERILENNPGMYVCEVRVGDIRAEGLEIERSQREGDPGHCDIKGRKTRGKAREISRKSTWAPGHGPPSN